jgi:hypothetical protein
MSSQVKAVPSITRHQGPNAGIVATVFTLLFLAGLYPVTAFNGLPRFPAPSEPLETIVTYFRARPHAVLLCAFFQFGSSISLGIFTATIVSQLRFLGVRAAGVYIALFGGWMTAWNIAATSCILWTMAHPGIAQDASLTQALYHLGFAFGGPGFSVPFGLLMAGVSVTSGFMRLLPRWIIVLGLILAVIGELSFLQLAFPKLLPLIPLTRFPGFIWLIAAGFALPKTISRTTQSA